MITATIYTRNTAVSQAQVNMLALQQQDYKPGSQRVCEEGNEKSGFIIFSVYAYFLHCTLKWK